MQKNATYFEIDPDEKLDKATLTEFIEFVADAEQREYMATHSAAVAGKIIKNCGIEKKRDMELQTAASL